MYDDYKNDLMTRAEYKREAEKLAEELDKIKIQINELESLEKQAAEHEDGALDNKLKVLTELETFDKEKLQEVIKVVQVYDQEHIEIVWNFDDAFQKL